MSKYNSKKEDSDDFDFDDDEDDDITESKGQESSLSKSADKKSYSPGPPKKFNVDEIIKKLLSDKVRNIGLTNEIPEQQIIDLIDAAKDIITSQPVFL